MRLGLEPSYTWRFENFSNQAKNVPLVVLVLVNLLKFDDLANMTEHDSSKIK